MNSFVVLMRLLTAVKTPHKLNKMFYEGMDSMIEFIEVEGITLDASLPDNAYITI